MTKGILIVFLALIMAAAVPAGASAAEAVEINISHIKMQDQQIVRTGPGEENDPMGILDKDQLAIVYGITNNNWYEIYYCQLRGYIKMEGTVIYQGGRSSEPSALPEKSKVPAVLNALGDSVTAGEKLSTETEAYASLLGAKLGMGTVNNYGLGGSAMSGVHSNRFLDRYLYMDAGADMILVFGGTNDYGFNTPLGSYGDNVDTSFYGGLNTLMCGLQQKYKDASIVFMTPLKRSGGMKKNQCGNTLNQYAQAIIDMADFYQMPVIDLYTPQELDFAAQKKEYMKDGIHPSAKAHRILADYIYGCLIHEADLEERDGGSNFIP